MGVDEPIQADFGLNLELNEPIRGAHEPIQGAKLGGDEEDWFPVSMVLFWVTTYADLHYPRINFILLILRNPTWSYAILRLSFAQPPAQKRPGSTSGPFLPSDSFDPAIVANCIRLFFDAYSGIINRSRKIVWRRWFPLFLSSVFLSSVFHAILSSHPSYVLPDHSFGRVLHCG